MLAHRASPITRKQTRKRVEPEPALKFYYRVRVHTKTCHLRYRKRNAGASHSNKGKIDVRTACIYHIGCTPRKCDRPGSTTYTYPEWYTSDIIKDIKEKAKWHKEYKISESEYAYEMFSLYRSQVKRKTEVEYENFKSRVQKQLIEDPYAFWSYVNNKRERRGKPHITKNGVVLQEYQCAQAFAEYFQSVFDRDAPRLDVEEAIKAAAEKAGTSADRVHVPSLTLQEVRVAIERLKAKKSVGPDGIPPFLIKDCASVLGEPLLYLYNLCLTSATYPEVWKTSRVAPVPKSGSGSDVCNFRPVAILSTIAKVFESILYTVIYPQVEARLSECQHGFRPGRGTHSNLMCFTQEAATALDKRVGGQMDVTYFDFKRHST
ncbi:hypothetical protein NE865_06653 [Phthorimaea operculella]|nr:hypothetical protein NE865_06653 [Phthorimaea operculella]